MAQAFELGRGTGVGDAKAAAHEAVAGVERIVDGDAQVGEMNAPRRHKPFEGGGVACTDDELESIAFGVELVEGFAAEFLDKFGWGDEAGEQALAELNGERGQRDANLFAELFVSGGEALEKTGLERLHLGAEIDDLLIGEIPRGVPTLLVASSASGEQFGGGVLADGVARRLHGDERPVKSDELVVDGHGGW